MASIRMTAELPLWTARLPATSGTTAAPRRRQNGIAAVVDFSLLAAVVVWANSASRQPRRSSTLTHIGINELRKGRVQLFHVLEAGLGFLSDFRQIKRLAIL